MSSLLDTLLAQGHLLFGQGARLLTLRFGPGSGLSDGVLLPQRAVGDEALSQSYRLEVHCLSPDIHLELKDLIGQSLELGLLLPEGGHRLFCGLVTRARQAGADGGFAHYVLTVEPALATLALRRNSRVFQDLTVPQIVAALLDEHRANNPVFQQSFAHRTDLGLDYPVRSYCLQHRESDLAFIERLLAEEGISYRYTHGPDATTSLSSIDHRLRRAEETPIVHTLVLFDTQTPTVAAGAMPIRFHRTDGINDADAIDRWTGERRLQPGETTLASWDYQLPATTPASQASTRQAGAASTELQSTLEDYAPQAPYYGRDSAELQRYAALRQQARDLASKTFAGEGSARHLVPGSWFALTEHPIHDHDGPEDREFLVTSLHFDAENNLTPEGQQTLGKLLGAAGGLPPRDSLRSQKKSANAVPGETTPPYRNTFTAVRRHVPVVPAYRDTVHAKPAAPGDTTATVVGPAGDEIHTDEYGRIKIQFHWQRPADHPQGGANFDEGSSTWVRVATPSAGAGWGSQYLPRVGQEVLVTFLDGDLDRPLVTGVLHNGSHPPPTFSGAGSLPANKALSGHKSREVQGSGYNELLFDDTPGQLRTKLSSEHGKTQLNLGYLTHPRCDGQAEARGEGFELRTDDAGAVRAAKGLLISAWQQLGARGGQLSRDETLALMRQSLDLFTQLGDYAAQHQGNPVDAGPQQKLNQALADWEQGSNTQAGGNGGTPVIAVSAPGGIHQSTPESQLAYAGQNLDQVAGQHLQQTAGGHATLNAGKGISLFAHDGGLKAIAHRGPLLLQSQHDETVINAEKSVRVTASQGDISSMADQEIVFTTAGGAYLKLAGGQVEFGCPGSFTVKAASHSLEGPGSMAPQLPLFSGTVCVPCLLAAMKSASPFAMLQ